MFGACCFLFVFLGGWSGCKKWCNEPVSTHRDVRFDFGSDFVCCSGKITASVEVYLWDLLVKTNSSCASHLLSCALTAESTSPEQFKPVHVWAVMFLTCPSLCFLVPLLVPVPTLVPLHDELRGD